MAGPARFPIVGIGASAGGIEALEGLFAGLGADGGLAYVVVTHVSPDRDSLLHEVVGRFTTLPVAQAEDGIRVRPGHVYVLPARRMMTIAGGRLQLEEQEPGYRDHNPIDVFLSSLAVDCGEYAIGIVLSGGGSDGTLGIKAIKERGGLTFAQGTDGTMPRHPSMPMSAISTGLVDLALPVREIGVRLVDYARSFGVIAGMEDAAVQTATTEILRLLHNQIGHDFSGYKSKTLGRRVQRRMQITRVARIEDYVEHLRSDPREVAALFRDLLINVTNFFRDASAFEALNTLVLPRLFEGRGAGDTIRVWVPGCATGEEVYSIAMLMREHLDGLEGAPRVQIFATDIDEAALAVARIGRYPAPSLDTVSPVRRGRFFVAEGNTLVITKEVRELCVFSPHSVIRDPPFSRIDLVSCRNLLIYFGATMQSQVIPIFHYALRPRGYLFLGTSENITHFADLFVVLDKRRRIFQARETGRPSEPLPLIVTGAKPSPFARESGRSEVSRPALVAAHGGLPQRPTLEQHVVERFAPPHVVVDQNGDVVYYSPRTGKYLEAPVGLPNRQLLSMARKGLRLDLRSAIREAMESRGTATREDLAVEGDEGRVQFVSVTVEPLPRPEGGQPLLIVVFHDQGPSLSRDEAQSRQASMHQNADVLQLDLELRDTRERLQAMIEEHETALEELKSSNEELVSVNEELQSTNEELEASKEELQSLNEELHTVNAELTRKIDHLDEANGDLRNLVDVSGLATVFLDRDFVIRTFTPSVAEFIPIQERDRGRPLTDLAIRPDYPLLPNDLTKVLESGQQIERRIEHSAGGGGSTPHLVRIVPYLTRGSEITGVVVTFVALSAAAQIMSFDRTDSNSS